MSDRDYRLRRAELYRIRLERRADRMRSYNLTHGRGCRSIARAIAQRTGGAA